MILSLPKLGNIITFEWDEANISHLAKHNVLPKEAEEIFFDKNNVQDEDIEHSSNEERFLIIGKTKKGRLLYQIFTIRENKPLPAASSGASHRDKFVSRFARNKIRVISSRDINKKEVKLYEKETGSS